MSISYAVKSFFEKIPMETEFSSGELMRYIARDYPEYKHKMDSTVTRRLRENRWGKGYGIVCIKPAQSLYKKVDLKSANKIKRQMAARKKAMA